MKSFSNECGSRNSFGYFDYIVQEIVLKRPCYKKSDMEEVCEWLDCTEDLRKFSLGIGPAENFVVGGAPNPLYTTARGIVKSSVLKNKYIDAEMLRNFLLRLKKQKKLRNLAIKCILFYDDPVLFDLLLETIREFDNLVYLDLTGCYFSDEQLVDLADLIVKAKIAHLVWPEPRMDKMVLAKVMRILEMSPGLVIMRGVPLEMQKIAQNNRENLFALGKRPSMIDEEEIELIRTYKNAIQLAIAYEKDKLLNLEKTFEAIIVDPSDRSDQIVKVGGRPTAPRNSADVDEDEDDDEGDES